MKFGICELAIVPIRKQPSDCSEMINQILFGEIYEVIESQNKWIKIQLNHDGYKGWISINQFIEINKKDYIFLKSHNSKVVNEKFITLIKNKIPFEIVIGSFLPFFKKNYLTVNDISYKLDKSLNKNNYSLLEKAKLFLNTPYLWGGRSIFGIDCSGFMQILFRLEGKTLPRDAYQQAKEGVLIDSLKNSQSGDLAFFNNNKGKIIHVGMIIEKDKIIHASGRVKIDLLDKKGIFCQENNIYTHNLITIKRI